MIKEAEAVVEGGCIIDAGMNVKMSSLVAFLLGCGVSKVEQEHLDWQWQKVSEC